MELTQEIKNLIVEAKNICLIPSPTHEPESLSATLALFYTLKELNKNVNLIIEDFPEKCNFLIPSLDFISAPKNFVISIPKNVAEISQVYYEKNEENLKIHLTIDKGSIKKDQISFYFSQAKPDLIIALGVQDFQKTLEGKLDFFGFLLESPIINIDNNLENKKYGKINIIEEKSLAQIVMDITKLFDQKPVPQYVANCLLTGLTAYYENFQKQNTPAQVFELCAYLMKQGANRQQIIENLYHKSDTHLPMTPEFADINNEIALPSARNGDQ